MLDDLEPIADLARDFALSSTVLFLGRHVGYPVALEGALKLKELAYIHAEGFAAGELKHGPIALIADGIPVIAVMPSPKNSSTLHAKPMSNIREIQARGAVTIVIAEEADETVRPYADHLIEILAVSSFSSRAFHDPIRGVARAVPRLRHRQAPQPGQVCHRRIIHNGTFRSVAAIKIGTPRQRRGAVGWRVDSRLSRNDFQAPTRVAGTDRMLSRSHSMVRWIPSTILIHGFHPSSSRASLEFNVIACISPARTAA